MPSIMGAVAKHIFLVTDPDKLEATVRTAFEIARTGRPGPVVIDIPKDVQNWEGSVPGEGMLPIPGYRRRMHELAAAALEPAAAAHFFAMLARGQAPPDLCRRRGDQRQCRRGAGRVRGGLRHPRRHDPDGHRRHRHHRAGWRCACSACTAPRSPTTPWMTATS